MTEQKKPKATFGDVMLGIPAGGSGDRDNKGGGRGGRPDGDKREERKGGPMVVVKRAGTVVETKKTSEAAAPAPAGGDEKAEAKPEVKPVVPAGPSVTDEVHEPETFAELFAKAGKDAVPVRKSVRVGEKVKGKIFQLGAEMAFLTIGSREAMIDLDELKDDGGVLRHGVGDEIEAHVLETGAKGILLSRRLNKSAASMSMLVEARASGMPVEGIVLAVNKGGLEVAVGDTRAFCPTSQIDVRNTGKAEELVGQRLTFRVTEVKERNVVLSRRALLEEENRAKAGELRKTLSVGKVVQGTVVNVQAFGAFVDLGGLEGLVPVSEMSHVRVGHPSDVVQVGQGVEVEVIRMEDAEPNSPDKAKRKERITLSMRKLMEDPFTKALDQFKEGMVVKGKIVRLQAFGAFVELMPGVDGLIHISAMSDRRIAHPRDAVKEGEEVEVKVEKVDPHEKRIGLRLVKDGVAIGEGVSTSGAAPTADGAPVAGDAKPRAPKAKRGQIVTGKVVRIEQYGIFLEYAEGQQGLVPGAETGTERGTDLRRVFPMGTVLKAEVVELEGQKVKLSIVAAQRSEERADLESWKSEQAKKVQSSGGFNSMADKLKGLTLK